MDSLFRTPTPNPSPQGGGRYAASACSAQLRRTAIFVVAFIFTTPASAAELAIEGVWGNETGCKVAGGGEYRSDDKIILHPDKIEAHESICEFVEVLSASGNRHVVTGICSGEGSQWVNTYIIYPEDGLGRLVVTTNDGAFTHVVGQCQ